MSGQDMKLALECKEPPAVPLWEIEFHCWEQAAGEALVLGREFEALSAAEQERAIGRNAEIMLAVAREFGYSAVTTPNGYWEVAPGEPAYYWLPDQWRWRQIEVLRRMCPAGEILLVGITGGVMGIPGARVYEEFCYRLIDSPDEVERQAAQLLDWGVQAARRMRDLGVEVAVSASDLADNRGPFYSPPQMERFILPYCARWAAAVREMGMYAVLHTDGNVEPILEGLCSVGLHGLQAVDPVAGMDFARTKALARGRLCLCGNIDCGLLQNGTPRQVYEATMRLLTQCAPGGGMVLGASNAVFREMPIENYRAMVAARREYAGRQKVESRRNDNDTTAYLTTDEHR